MAPETDSRCAYPSVIQRMFFPVVRSARRTRKTSLGMSDSRMSRVKSGMITSFFIGDNQTKRPFPGQAPFRPLPPFFRPPENVPPSRVPRHPSLPSRPPPPSRAKHPRSPFRRCGILPRHKPLPRPYPAPRSKRPTPHSPLPSPCRTVGLQSHPRPSSLVTRRSRPPPHFILEPKAASPDTPPRKPKDPP